MFNVWRKKIHDFIETVKKSEQEKDCWSNREALLVKRYCPHKKRIFRINKQLPENTESRTNNSK